MILNWENVYTHLPLCKHWGMLNCLDWTVEYIAMCTCIKEGKEMQYVKHTDSNLITQKPLNSIRVSDE